MAARSSALPITIAVGGLVVLVLAFGSVFTVNEREHAVVLEFGRPVRGISEPGLYFKVPVIQEVRRLPKTKQFWASDQNDMIVDVPTADGKKIEVSAWAVWRITDPRQFVTVLRTVDNAERQVRTRVRAAIRDTITDHELAEVVRSTDRELTNSFGLDELPSELGDVDVQVDVDGATELAQAGEQTSIEFGREELLRQIRDRVQEELRTAEDPSGGGLDRGIELLDVGVSNLSFAESIRQAAFERLKAYMDAIAAAHTNAGIQRKQEIINQTNAEVESILGEGEERSKRIRGEVEAEIIEKYATAIRETGDFYNFQRTLEVYEKVLDADTRLILTTDSDLFRMLKAVGKPGKLGEAPAE